MGDTRKKRQDGVRSLADIKGRCIVDDGGCWIWRGAMSCVANGGRQRNPTPRVWVPEGAVDNAACGFALTGAKAAWVLAGKVLPDGHVVWRHLCSQTICINPAHGKSGTRQEMHKAVAASGRLKGDPRRAVINAQNRAAMVKPAEVVRQAEAMLCAGRLQKDIRADLQLTRNTMLLIRKRQHPHSSNRQRVVRGASVFNLGG